ncbi:hypothetical protein NOS3756_33390 [Nostoc sp. NIES-3756]|nr:hypothetical protein NOS3756_33390 [Nostoc sp. NIES-3756]
MLIYPRLRNFWLLFLIIAIAACQKVQSHNNRLAPLPQDSFVKVYFNQSESSEYKEPYRQQTRLGDNLEQQIIDAISQAKSTVDIAVQELRLPRIAQALADKQKSGIKVRVILENTYSRPLSSLTPDEIKKLDTREKARYQEYFKFIDLNQDNKLSLDEINQQDALMILRNAKIPWIDDQADGSAGTKLMHHKFLVVDNQIVIATSANFTLSDTMGDLTNPNSLGNANNLLHIDSPEIAALFTEEFNLMWGDGPGGKPDSKFGIRKPLRSFKTITLGDNEITVHFSPTSPTLPWSQSSNGLIEKTLKSAKKSVDMALFVFSEQSLANTLEQVHQKDIAIRALIDRQFAYRYYSEALDMMGVSLSNKCQYEINNKPWSNPVTTVGIPNLRKGDILHHKFALVDNRTVITGSHNWSDTANYGNDETLIVINNPVIAAHYEREFNRLYTKAQVGVPERVQAQIQKEQKQCNQIKSPTSEQIITPGVVNINTAISTELQTLPGVGKKLAQKIIIARQQQKITSIQDLDKIPGISQKMIDKWQGRIQF